MQYDLGETMTMCTDIDLWNHPLKVFLQCLLAANCENSSEIDELLVIERDGECHEAVVCDREVPEGDYVSEVGLVWEIDELDDVSDVDYTRLVRSDRLMSDDDDWWAG